MTVTVLYDQLKKVKIVCPVANLEDVRRIRRQRSVDFAALVKDALGMIGQLVCRGLGEGSVS